MNKEKKQALIVVDVQNDFCPGGALPVPEGDSVVPLLNRWVAEYVNADDQSSPAISARRPLREARVEVSEDPGRPGTYRVVAFLRPYFQLDDLSVSLRVVGRIP